MPGLCLFDLDGTLAEGRTVFRLAARFGRVREVEAALGRSAGGHVGSHDGGRVNGRGAGDAGPTAIAAVVGAAADDEPAAGDAESRRVMAAFAGVPAAAFAAACADLPLRDRAPEAVDGLRALGFRVGVVTATYAPAAQAAARRLGLDVAVGLAPEATAGVLTGRLGPAPCPGPCGRPVCKETALARLRRPGETTAAVGDGANDACMLAAADAGVALAPCHPLARAAARAVAARLDEVPALVQRLLEDRGRASRNARGSGQG